MILDLYAFAGVLSLAVGFTLYDDPSGFPEVICPKYACGTLTNGECARQVDDVIEVSECPDHTFCGPTNHCDPLSSKYGPMAAYAGEICSDSVVCVDSECRNGRCYGKTIGQTCNRHTECSPGLFCGFFCRPQLPVGTVGCRDDWDCVNGAGCNFGECVEYYSLGGDRKVDTCINFENRLCSTGVCRDNRCLYSLSSLSPGFPIPCSSPLDCPGSDSSGRLLYTECQCGLNENGRSYCGTFPDDEVGSDFNDVMQLWTSSELISKCNTFRRWATHCMVSNWKKCRVEEYLYKQYRYIDFSRIVDNSDCVSKSLTRDYWDLRTIFKEEAERSIECVFAHEYGTFLVTDSDDI